MQLRTEKEFKTEINVNWPEWPCILVYKFAEQISSSAVSCFSSSVMFDVAFVTLPYYCMFVVERQSGKECVCHKITLTSSSFATNLLTAMF